MLKPWAYLIGLGLGFSLALGIILIRDAIEQGESGWGAGFYTVMLGLTIIAMAIHLKEEDALDLGAVKAPLRPHELLQKYIDDKGTTAEVLAFRANINLTEMRFVLSGAAKITPAFSKRISVVLGTPPETWSDVQRDYDALTESPSAPKLGAVKTTEGE